MELGLEPRTTCPLKISMLFTKEGIVFRRLKVGKKIPALRTSDGFGEINKMLFVRAHSQW